MEIFLIFILIFSTVSTEQNRETKSSNEVTQNAIDGKSSVIFPMRKRYEDPDYSKIIIYIPKQDDLNYPSLDELPLFDKIHKTIFSFFDKIMKQYRDDAEIQEEEQASIGSKNNFCEMCNVGTNGDHSCKNNLINILNKNVLKQNQGHGLKLQPLSPLNPKDQEVVSTKTSPLVDDFLSRVESKLTANNLAEQEFNKIDNLRAFKMANDIKALKAAVIYKTKGIFEDSPKRVEEFPITKEYLKSFITGNQKLVFDTVGDNLKDATGTKQSTSAREQKRELKENETRGNLDDALVMMRKPNTNNEATRNLREISNVTEPEEIAEVNVEVEPRNLQEANKDDKKESKIKLVDVTREEFKVENIPTKVLEVNLADLKPELFQRASIEDEVLKNNSTAEEETKVLKDALLDLKEGEFLIKRSPTENKTKVAEENLPGLKTKLEMAGTENKMVQKNSTIEEETKVLKDQFLNLQAGYMKMSPNENKAEVLGENLSDLEPKLEMASVENKMVQKKPTTEEKTKVLKDHLLNLKDGYLIKRSQNENKTEVLGENLAGAEPKLEMAITENKIVQKNSTTEGETEALKDDFLDLKKDEYLKLPNDNKKEVLVENVPNLKLKIEIPNIMEDRIVQHVTKVSNKTKRTFDANNFLLSSGGTEQRATALKDTLAQKIKTFLEEEPAVILNRRGKRQLENATFQENVTKVIKPRQAETVSDPMPEVKEAEKLKEDLEESNGENPSHVAKIENRKVRSSNIEKENTIGSTRKSSNQYILTVTIPSVLAIGGIIFLLCYVTRTAGWFCNLFTLQTKERPTRATTSHEEDNN